MYPIIIGLASLGVSKLIKLVAATCPPLYAKSPKKEALSFFIVSPNLEQNIKIGVGVGKFAVRGVISPNNCTLARTKKCAYTSIEP